MLALVQVPVSATPGLAAQVPPPAMPLLTAHTKPVDTALVSLHYVFPAAVFGYFIIASGIAIFTLADKTEHPRRRSLMALMAFSILSYLAQIAAILVPSIIMKEWLGQQDAIISLLSCILVFGLQLAMLSDEKEVAWYPYIGPYLFALVFEPALEIVTLSARVGGPLSWPEIVQLSVVASRYLAIGLVVATYFTWRKVQDPKDTADSEQQPLIPKNPDGTPAQVADRTEDSQSSASYGSTTITASNSAANSTTEDAHSEDAADPNGDRKSTTSDEEDNANELPWERRERKRREQMENRLKEHGNWFGYTKRFLVFFPYIWPVNNRPLQIRAVLVGACLLANNALNVLIPRQLGIILDSLGHSNDKNPWVQVVIFAGLKFAASQAGISLLRQWLWLPVEYYSFGAMSIAAYSHVLNLSSDFHDSKSSSDIMMAITSGQSIANLLESLCFSAVPMLIDMTIAFMYLSATFGPYEGFITFATAIIFLYIAGRMIAGLKTARRGEVSAWFEEHYVRQAGIQGWSTVASFNQVGHEEERYSNAVKTRVARSQDVYIGYLLAYALQYLVLLAGLLAGSFLAVWQVTSGQSTPGKFAMLLTYWTQLVAPLTFFAGLGKSISRNFVHAEQLLEIMSTKPTVVNKPDAPELEFSGGGVDFKNVSFSYSDKKSILKNITFTIQPGMTVAIVGATGAGKSTILKLLDRFYDVTEGSIKIDGQDIRDVDLQSLRSRIGIVPQAPILFDDTVKNNVRYAKLDATDEEVYNACRAAAIHDQILGFAEGYESRVGERGIKLSGGELQRVAIARAILKDPSIVLLDEATSSVDTETEQRIQEALQALCAGRTTVVVAHRLSTVMNADCIIVVSDGEIIEKGSHDELIQCNGKYASLWSKQVFTKPKDDKSTNAKTVGSMSDLVNDLSPESVNNEMAKANKSIKTTSNLNGVNKLGNGSASKQAAGSGLDEGSDDACIKGDTSASREVDSGSETATETNSSSVRKKEETHLNPIAASFTPRAMSETSILSPGRSHNTFATTPATAGDPLPPLGIGAPTKNTGYDQQPAHGLGKAGGDVQLPAPDLRSTTSGTSNNSGSGRTQRSTDATELDGSSEPFVPQDSEMNSYASGGSGSRGSLRGRGRYNKVKWVRPRYNRRAQSKSEPTTTKQTDN